MPVGDLEPVPASVIDDAGAVLKLQDTFGTKDGRERLDDLDRGLVLSVRGGLLRRVVE